MSTKYTSKKLEKDFGPITLADLLLISREDLELTQVAMAKKLDVSKQKLCDFEKGRRVPSAKLAASWAKILKQPKEVWVQVVLQDQLRRDNINLKVDIQAS